MWAVKNKCVIQNITYPYLLTCLPLFPTVVSNISHIILFDIFLNLLQSWVFKLGLEIAGDVVLDTQVLRLPFYSLTCGPKADGEVTLILLKNEIKH